MNNWWQIDIQEIAKLQKTDLKQGLSPQEIPQRLAQYGPNQLKEKKGISPLTIFIEQFNDFIIWVLIAAALVSGLMREWIDALAIVAIVIVNSILGFIQTFRAEKALAALKKLSSPTSKVIRGGQLAFVSSSELVPGDLIELEAGDNVPADSRLVYLTPNFTSHEASLTGESTPVSKTIFALEEKDVPLADRANLLYLGTSVASGKARAIVIGTGMDTELGKIADLIQCVEKENTPLQKKLEQFGRWIVYLCFVLVAMVFGLGVLRGGDWIEMFLTSVSLAVAAIPEGLPAVVTMALALGVQKMVKRHALIRKLLSVETLGSTTVICSDKTGTLTKNEMTVKFVFAGNQLFKISGVGYEPKGEILLNDQPIRPASQTALMQTLLCGVLCNGAQLVEDSGRYKIVGDPTEGAVLTCAGKADIWKDKLEKEHEMVEEIPFDSDRKMMSVIQKGSDGKLVAYVKGAPDILISRCVNLSEAERFQALKANNELADQALRVLGCAYRELNNSIKKEADEIEKELNFVGLVAMMDPPRPEVKTAIAECKSAGIKTVMITGDHKNTAAAVARELGFFTADSQALSGEELDRLNDDELFARIGKIPVYARVSPEHKLRIVRAWKKRGEVVAMTGDGVNDGPAVKEADIGVAMGITGTDVTKEVSDMVVLDDNFASIVAAVEEGRGIYDNIKKFVQYLLSCNAGEILVMFVSSLIGWPLPLLPIHILWVNLVTDGFPALALGVDPVDPGVMHRPPRKTNEAIVDRKRAWSMLLEGTFIAFCSLAAFAFVLFLEDGGLMRARTAAFIVLSCSQLFHAFNCRSDTKSIFRIGVFSNPQLVMAVLFSFALQMAVVYTPFLQIVFKTEALSLTDWAMVIAISSLPLWAMESVKKVRRA